jgi:short-chain fatty acids transporter
MTTNEDPKATSEGPAATGTAKPKRRGVMQSLTALCVRYVERVMPDPFLFAVILTLIVAALVALLVNGASPSDMLKRRGTAVCGDRRTSSRSPSRWS